MGARVWGAWDTVPEASERAAGGPDKAGLEEHEIYGVGGSDCELISHGLARA
jgi:hypothetical protein